MSRAGKVLAVALLAALVWAGAAVTEAQPPIRIGATLSQTGAYALRCFEGSREVVASHATGRSADSGADLRLCESCGAKLGQRRNQRPRAPRPRACGLASARAPGARLRADSISASSIHRATASTSW